MDANDDELQSDAFFSLVNPPTQLFLYRMVGFVLSLLMSL